MGLWPVRPAISHGLKRDQYRQLNDKVSELDTIDKGDMRGLQKINFELQKITNLMKQIFESITNLQKSQDDTNEAIIRNFA